MLNAEQKTVISIVAMVCVTVIILASLIVWANNETPEERASRIAFEREMNLKEMETFMRIAPFIAKSGTLSPDF